MMAQPQSSPSRHRSLAPLLCGLREGNPRKQTQTTLPGGKPEPGHPTSSLATGIVAGASTVAVLESLGFYSSTRVSFQKIVLRGVEV